MPPIACPQTPGLAIHLAEDVVEKYVGAARSVGTCITANYCIEAVERLDRVALEPVI
jgi:hypothetical protein